VRREGDVSEEGPVVGRAPRLTATEEYTRVTTSGCDMRAHQPRKFLRISLTLFIHAADVVLAA